MAKLTWINGVGVIALAVLCVAQWADSRRIRTELDGALSDRDAIAGELATARQSVEDQASDIDRFRETINDLRARLEKAEAGAASGEGMDQALDEWKRAVEERDARLAEYEQTLNQLAADMEERTKAYNGLADQYNELVEELDERTRAYNDAIRRR